MSIKADINKKDLVPENELKVHFIPATIDGNGPIKIDEYFNSYTKEENGGKYCLL
jgi:ribonuclease H2 subunit C